MECWICLLLRGIVTAAGRCSHLGVAPISGLAELELGMGLVDGCGEIWDLAIWVSDLGIGIWELEFRIWELEFRIWELEFVILPISEIPEMGAILQLVSEIGLVAVPLISGLEQVELYGSI